MDAEVASEATPEQRNIGNSVLVVEHDKDIMMAADYLIDIGPKAGRFGGHIVAQGTPAEVLKSGSDTAAYLNGTKGLAIPNERRQGNGKLLELKGVVGNNLKGVSVVFPLGKLIVVTGVSGSGKSTLINETLYPILSKHAYNSRTLPMEYKSVKPRQHQFIGQRAGLYRGDAGEFGRHDRGPVPC